jgi:hypothetical protein
VVRSFSTGGVTQENGKGYSKCVNTSQVERDCCLRGEGNKKKENRSSFTNDEYPKLTDCSITKRRRYHIYIVKKTTTDLFNGLRREYDAIPF